MKGEKDLVLENHLKGCVADTRCPSKQNGKRGGDLDGLRQTKNIHMPYASGSRF